MIAGLLESNQKIRWTFDKFFNSTNDIMNKITIKVFDCSTGINNKLYIDKKDRFAQFQEAVARTTEIAAGEQLILFHNRELGEIIEGTIQMQNWPKNLLRGQVYLYQREKLDQQRLVLPEIPPLPQFPSKVTLDRDCYVAHKMAAISCLMERYIAMCIIQQEIMLQSENYLRDYILRITRKINNCIPDMCKMLLEHKSRQNVFYNCYDSQLRMCVVLRKPSPTSTTEAEFLRFFDRLHEVVEDKNPWTVLNKAESRSQECKVYMEVLMQKIKEQEDEAIAVCVGCLEEDHCMQKAEYINSKVCDIHLVFLRHKKQRILPEEESFGHEADRAKLMDLCVQIVSLLQSHCLLNLTRVYNVVGKQISLLLKNLQRTKKVEQNITSVTECCEKLSKRMERMETECKELSSKLIPAVHSLMINNQSTGQGIRETTGQKPGDSGTDTGYDTETPSSSGIVSKQASQISNDHGYFSPQQFSKGHSALSKLKELPTSRFLSSGFTSIAHKLESGFQSLNQDSMTVSQNLEENNKILEEQDKMVAQLGQIGLAGSEDT